MTPNQLIADMQTRLKQLIELEQRAAAELEQRRRELIHQQGAIAGAQLMLEHIAAQDDDPELLP